MCWFDYQSINTSTIALIQNEILRHDYEIVSDAIKKPDESFLSKISNSNKKYVIPIVNRSSINK